MLPLTRTEDVVYPDSDGNPMADNTLQYEWMHTLKGNLDLLFAHRRDVFVAGDNLIYPVEGNPTIRLAPDVYAAFGRPKGYRGSYQVWKEDGIFPQVVFEVLSPNNTRREMETKREFYEEYGAEEFYILDPERTRMAGYILRDGTLEAVEHMDGWVSPRLEVRFERTDDDLELFGPDGERFRTFVELGQLRLETAGRLKRQVGRANRAQERAERERQRADEAERLREAEKARAEKLAAKLRELGIDPDA